MKKSTKLIVMLTVITVIAGLLGFAAADDKIYTSPVFKIPKDRVIIPAGPDEIAPEADPEAESGMIEGVIPGNDP